MHVISPVWLHWFQLDGEGGGRQEIFPVASAERRSGSGSDSILPSVLLARQPGSPRLGIDLACPGARGLFPEQQYGEMGRTCRPD